MTIRKSSKLVGNGAQRNYRFALGGTNEVAATMTASKVNQTVRRVRGLFNRLQANCNSLLKSAQEDLEALEAWAAAHAEGGTGGSRAATAGRATNGARASPRRAAPVS